MSTDFLLLSAARTLSLRDIYAAGEEAATFCKLRWQQTNGQPACPKCGSHDAYKVSTRHKFECRDKSCRHQFSPTSGTIFASRKLAFEEDTEIGFGLST